MFELIHILNEQNNPCLQIKTKLFAQSLMFYRNEQIIVDHDLLKSTMNYLSERPNSVQALGLAKYIFLNEIATFT